MEANEEIIDMPSEGIPLNTMNGQIEDQEEESFENLEGLEDNGKRYVILRYFQL